MLSLIVSNHDSFLHIGKYNNTLEFRIIFRMIQQTMAEIGLSGGFMNECKRGN